MVESKALTVRIPQQNVPNQAINASCISKWTRVHILLYSWPPHTLRDLLHTRGKKKRHKCILWKQLMSLVSLLQNLHAVLYCSMHAAFHISIECMTLKAPPVTYLLKRLVYNDARCCYKFLSLRHVVFTVQTISSSLYELSMQRHACSNHRS